MNSNERALHDWFDRELDRLLASPAEADLDDPDLQTAQLIQRLDSNQQPDPDDRFLRDLEAQLMPSAPALAAPRTSLRLLLEQFLTRFQIEHRHHRRASRFASALSVLLLLAVIGATGYVALDGGNSSDPTPTAANGAAVTETSEAVGAQASPPVLTEADWTYAPQGNVQRIGSMAFANGTLFRLIETDAFTGIESLDGVEGTPGWTRDTAWESRGLAATDDGLYFVSAPGTLTSISALDGGDRWSIDLPGTIVGFTLEGDVLYVWDETATMTAVRTSDGSTIWQKATGDPGGAQNAADPATQPEIAPVVGWEGEAQIVAMVSANGNLNLFSKETGDIMGSLTGFDPVNTRISILLERNLFVLSQRVPGDPSSGLRGYGINLDMVRVDWEIDIDGGLTQPSVYGSDGGMVYVIGDDARTPGADLFNAPTPRVDYDSGRNPWTADVPMQQESGDGTGGMRVYGINAFTGDIVWITTSKAGPFVMLNRGCHNSCGLEAITSDGIVVDINRGAGGVDGVPFNLSAPVLEITNGGSAPDGSRYSDFVTLNDGSIVAFGYVPFSEMG
jgi:hypothetical protein